jgi:aspartate racemase
MTAAARPRVIGMLGGMSWESSAEYYRLANELVRERLGGLHSARCVLASLDFAEVERLQVAGEWSRAGDLLAEAARGLEAAGADLLVLCTNTMHKVADQVQAAVGIPLLHLADAVGEAVTAAGLDTVGLLGTAFTMEQDFYRERLARHGLRVLVPPADDRALVHRVIYDELCLGVVREESREGYRGVIRRLAEAGARGVVLGCTEIELLVGQADSPVPVFPTTRLHVEAAVTAALAAQPAG